MSKIPNRGCRYRSVLLKLSGECFLSPSRVDDLVRQVALVREKKVALAIVVGGGNLLRGRDEAQLDRVDADHCGMLATVINGIRLHTLLEKKVPSRHLCALDIPGITERYSVARGRETLERNEVLVLSGGTGNPFFSTDSAAALRAAELRVEILLKATNVAGVFSADPRKNKQAKFYPRVSYEQALKERLAVMDLSAFAFCLEHKIPIRVFDLHQPDSIINIISGKEIGSLVC